METPASQKIAKLWKISNEYLNQVWKYWEHHYLLSLREREEKMKSAYRNTPRKPIVGEAVLMIDPKRERGTWKIGKILELITSQDGEIRLVKIKLMNGNLTIRLLSKIAPLELNVEDIQREEENPMNETDPEFNEIEETECVVIEQQTSDEDMKSNNVSLLICMTAQKFILILPIFNVKVMLEFKFMFKS